MLYYFMVERKGSGKREREERKRGKMVTRSSTQKGERPKSQKGACPDKKAGLYREEPQGDSGHV